MSYDFLFKLIFIGDAGVGKSHIVGRLNHMPLEEIHSPTIGIDFITKTFSIQNHIIKLQIWDTAGQEYFRSLIKSYYKDICGAVLVYDISNEASFENIDRDNLHRQILKSHLLENLKS